MRFDVVLANPPYSIKQWDRDAFASDPWGRNLYGPPPSPHGWKAPRLSGTRSISSSQPNESAT